MGDRFVGDASRLQRGASAPPCSPTAARVPYRLKGKETQMGFVENRNGVWGFDEKLRFVWLWRLDYTMEMRGEKGGG